MPARRLVMVALALVSAALLAWLSRVSAAPTSTTAAAHRPRNRHSASARTTDWVTFRPHVERASWAIDAGVHFPDAGPPLAPEPELAMTGVVAREVTARVCPRAASVLCGARDRFACGPLSTEDETYPEDEPPLSCVERISFACEDWARRTYGAAPDLLVLEESAVAPCLADLETDATTGLGVSGLDVGCSDLAVNARRVGEACEASWYRCVGGDCVEHRCVARPGNGAPCDEGLCEIGLVCVAGLCGPPTPHGAACDAESVCAERGDACVFGRCIASVPDGGVCVEDVDCELSSRCALGRCVVAGDSCAYDEECGRGRFCSGMWAARCIGVEVGAPCVSTRDCDPGLTCLGSLCVLAPAAAPGTRGENESCDAYGAPLAQCLPGLACVWAVDDGTCMASLCAEPDPFARVMEEDCH